MILAVIKCLDFFLNKRKSNIFPTYIYMAPDGTIFLQCNDLILFLIRHRLSEFDPMYGFYQDCVDRIQSVKILQPNIVY